MYSYFFSHCHCFSSAVALWAETGNVDAGKRRGRGGQRDLQALAGSEAVLPSGAESPTTPSVTETGRGNERGKRRRWTRRKRKRSCWNLPGSAARTPRTSTPTTPWTKWYCCLVLSCRIVGCVWLLESHSTGLCSRETPRWSAPVNWGTCTSASRKSWGGGRREPKKLDPSGSLPKPNWTRIKVRSADGLDPSTDGSERLQTTDTVWGLRLWNCWCGGKGKRRVFTSTNKLTEFIKYLHLSLMVQMWRLLPQQELMD